MKIRPDQLWTDDEKQQVKDLWAGGNSAGVIAKQLGRTRNAVISIIFRMKLPKRSPDAQRITQVAAAPRSNGGAKAGEGTTPKAKPAKASKPELVAESTTVHAVAVSLALPLESLRLHGVCKFVINGDAPVADYLFCGLDAVEGGSWCAHHRRIVFAGVVWLKEAA